MKNRDLPALLCAIVEAGVAHCGSVTFIVPGRGELTVGAKELRGFIDELHGPPSAPPERRAPAPLNASPFPTT